MKKATLIFVAVAAVILIAIAAFWSAEGMTPRKPPVRKPTPPAVLVNRRPKPVRIMQHTPGDSRSGGGDTTFMGYGNGVRGMF